MRFVHHGTGDGRSLLWPHHCNYPSSTWVFKPVAATLQVVAPTIPVSTPIHWCVALLRAEASAFCVMETYFCTRLKLYGYIASVAAPLRTTDSSDDTCSEIRRHCLNRRRPQQCVRYDFLFPSLPPSLSSMLPHASLSIYIYEAKLDTLLWSSVAVRRWRALPPFLVLLVIKFDQIKSKECFITRESCQKHFWLHLTLRLAWFRWLTWALD